MKVIDVIEKLYGDSIVDVFDIAGDRIYCDKAYKMYGIGLANWYIHEISTYIKDGYSVIALYVVSDKD